MNAFDRIVNVLKLIFIFGCFVLLVDIEMILGRIYLELPL